MAIQRFRDVSIRRKQTLIILLTSGVALFIAGAAFVAYDLMIFRREMVENASSLAEVVGNNCTGSLDFNDPKSAAESLAALRGEASVIFACIYDREGRPFATYARNHSRASAAPPVKATSHEFTREQLQLFRNITVHGEVIGTIYIASSLDEFTERITAYAGIVVVVLVGSLLVALLLSSLLQRVISGPILELAALARAVAQEKNYSLRARKPGEDEVGQLVGGFNEMLAEIQERDFALQAARESLEFRVSERTAELATTNQALQAEIAERQQAEVALRESRQIIEGIINAIPVRVFWKDKNLVYLGCNAAFARDAGFADPKDVIGKDDYQMGWQAQAELYRGDDRQIIEGGNSKLFIEEPQTTTKGDTIALLTSKLPLRSATGEICGVIGTYVDISERKRAEESLRESEERFSGAFEHAPIGVALVSPDGHWLRVNKALCDLVGYSEAELLACTFQDITHPDDLEGDLENVRRMLAREIGSYQIEKRYFHKDGHVVAALLNVSLVCDGKGQPRYFISQIQDITERKRAEETLRRTEALYRSAITGAGAVPYSYDFQTRTYAFMGEGIKQLIGYAPNEVNGQLWDRILEKSIMLGEAAGLDLTEAARRVKAGELRYWRCDMLITTRDGKPRWISDASVQNLDAAGRVTGSVGILQDITERKEAEAELERIHQQLLEVSRAAGMAEVASSVLHNVGNVLNSVNTSASVVADRLRLFKLDGIARVAGLLEQNRGNLAEFLSTDDRADQVVNFLKSLAQHLASEQEVALNELKELTQNIEHIKDIVVMQQSYAKISGVAERIKPADLVEDALRMNAGALTRHEVQLAREYDPQAPEIIVEKHRVLQILVNLIRNAKYACDESGRPEKRLTVSVSNGGDGVRITVKDNGVGIPPENLNRIFNHGFTTRKGGHGFGLHSGALAAKELGGSLTAHSDGPGCGATFMLELPITKTQSEPCI